MRCDSKSRPITERKTMSPVRKKTPILLYVIFALCHGKCSPVRQK